ncbi:MAG: arginine deiminase family protein [Pseudomonadota bacterium]
MDLFQFDRAIVRRPAASVVNGLRAVDRGAPDFDQLGEEHLAYVEALEAAGVTVTVLPPAPAFPDAVFVEDPALVFSNGAVALRPGAASRFGEAAEMLPVLREHFANVLQLPGPGSVEGGDVLITPDKVLVGLSERTNVQGAEALMSCLNHLGLRGAIVQTPPDVLHFKSDCSMLDNETVLSTRRLAASGVFNGLRTILVPQGEEAAANALRINDRVLIGSHFHRTIDQLSGQGYSLEPLKTNEISKLDAGLSCMSLRWRSAIG